MDLYEMGRKAQDASRTLALTDEKSKNLVLLAIAHDLQEEKEKIMEANKKDLEQGKANGLSTALLDRLALNAERIAGMAKGVRDIVTLPDPTGRILAEINRPNGLVIRKVSVPLGVIGVIFEARPNVTSDAAALCLKAGNAVILRGGKEAIHSNTAIVETMRQAVRKTGMSPDIIQLVTDTSRESAAAMMTCKQYLDLLIPRGGAGLIRTVVEQASVPVIETGTGNCHIYVDRAADLDKAISIVYNAKTSRPSVCNAAESLLLHKDIAENALSAIKEHLDTKGVILHGDEESRKFADGILPAEESDWEKEYSDYEMSIKVVESLEDAISHIHRYGTGHSECIITENLTTAETFLNAVDAAAVYVNASTRFTDGGEFGYGAEIGISTQKLHARGPIGLPELNTYKFKIYGEGQIRS